MLLLKPYTFSPSDSPDHRDPLLPASAEAVGTGGAAEHEESRRGGGGAGQDHHEAGRATCHQGCRRQLG